MKIDRQDLEDRRVQLTVEVPGERLEAAMHSAARRIGNRTRIPGFRPGKAPYKMIVQKVGEEAVFEEALDSLGQEVYRQALEESAIEPYAPGSLDEVVTRDPLTLRYTVPLLPEVELDDYRSLRLPLEEPEVADEAVDQMVEELRQTRAVVEPVDRPAQMGDVVVLDVRGTLQEPESGKDPTLLDERGVSVLVAESTDWPVPGIAEHLLGLKPGESRTVPHTFPETYANESLRGREGEFRLSCHEVKSRTVPELTDELARQMGDFGDVLDLKLKVRKGLLEEGHRRAESDHAQAVVDAVVSKTTLRYPPVMLDEELQAMLRDLDRRLQAQRLSLADYLKIEKKSLDELKKELEPKAIQRLKRALVLGKVVEVEDLDVEDQEVTAELDRVVAPLESKAGQVRKAIDNPAGRRSIAMDLLTQKAIQRLVAIARGLDPAASEPQAQDLQSQPPAADAA